MNSSFSTWTILYFFLQILLFPLPKADRDLRQIQGFYQTTLGYKEDTATQSTLTCAARCLNDIACDRFLFENNNCTLFWKDEDLTEGREEIFVEKKRTQLCYGYGAEDEKMGHVRWFRYKKRRYSCVGGWILVYRRERCTDLDQNWKRHVAGFGVPNRDYFIGLDLLNFLTQTTSYRAKVEIETMDSNKYLIEYATFKIGNSTQQFRLYVSMQLGNLSETVLVNDIPFSTIDRHNDDVKDGNCADKWGFGWWHSGQCDAELIEKPVGNTSCPIWYSVGQPPVGIKLFQLLIKPR